MAGASKPASLKGMADRPSAAADFCNKICQIQTSRMPQLTNIRAATLTILGLLSELQGGGDHECRWTGIYFAALRTLMLTPSRLPSEELDTGHCRLHRAVPVDAIRPFPKHCLQGGGNILRPGCIGCMTFGNPVPSHAGHSTSG